MEVTRTLMTKPVVKPASSPAPGPTLVLAAAPAAPSVGITGLDSKLLQDKVVDRILGCIYGNALGDAYGLATEFMYRPQIEAAYGNAAAARRGPFLTLPSWHHDSLPQVQAERPQQPLGRG